MSGRRVAVVGATGGLGSSFVDALLAEAGTDKRALISITVVLADIRDAPAMNRAWDAWLDPGHKPARITIQAPLVDPAWKVEITGVALAP
jgi:enamine deaminase RidA (YjgF/YER057c/UK114 family)